MLILFFKLTFLLIEKASEIAASTKEAIITGEKIAEEKLTAAKETIKGLLFFIIIKYFFIYIICRKSK